MSVHLTTYTLLTLMTDALQQAANAFALLTEADITLQPPILGSAKDSGVSWESDSVYVLTTELKGDLHGKSYLFLTRRDVIWVINHMKVYRMADTEQLTGLQQAALLELDNILSATAIARIANHLNIFCYGGVPALQVLSDVEITELLAETKKQYPLSVHASYHTENYPLQTRFVWMFESSLVQTHSQIHV